MTQGNVGSPRRGGLSNTSREFIARAAERLEGETPAATALRISQLTDAHEMWRGTACLNMNAAEGLMSLGARRLLATDLATRVTEGAPGDKLFPHRNQNRFIDEIEATLIALTRKMFDVRYVEWRPVSTSMANAAIFCSLTTCGDTLLVQSEDAGGNYSYNPPGFPPLLGLKVAFLPYTGHGFELDIDRTAEVVRRVKPRLIVIGGSNVLFPYPVGDLRSLADEVGALLVYDAAHLGLLIANGQFQSPLKEGAHIMTISTHKIMAGAVGGMVLTNDSALGTAVSKTVFPPLLQTRDQNKYAATAYAFAEHMAFGTDYAAQIVANARALGSALDHAGFEVFCSGRGYTRSHQVFVRHPGTTCIEFEDRCQHSNILVARTRRTAGILGASGGNGKHDEGVIRLSVQELTRQGFMEGDMTRVTGLIHGAVTAIRNAADTSREIAELLAGLGAMRFSFDERAGAGKAAR